MVVRGEEASAADSRDEVFHHRVRDRGAVEGGRTASQLVQDAKRVFRGAAQDRRCLRQLNEEGALSRQDPVCGAYSSEYPVHWTQLTLVRRHATTHLRQNGDETGLTQQGGLPAHVGSTQQQQLGLVGGAGESLRIDDHAAETEVVRNISSISAGGG